MRTTNTNTNQENAFMFFCAASFFSLCLILLPWLSTHMSLAINSDIAYLTLSARRLLDGMSMNEAYFDTTPPLSVIIQIPAAALTKFTGLPLYYATNFLALTLLALSLAAINALLSFYKELTPENRVAILGAYLLANTIHAGYDFGQKDQFLGMALFPLVLTQILITRGVTLPTIMKHCILAAGSLFILIKPHYGIVPAAIFIHRAATQRRINIVFDTDFLWLSAMAVAYVAAIFLFFEDFLTTILPDVVKYYASDISAKSVFTGIILMLQAITPFFIAQIFLKKAPELLSALSLITVLCFIPFIMQGKGWVYHALPADMFFYSTVILFINYGITAGLNALSKADMKSLLPRLVGFVLSMALLFILITRSYMTAPTQHFTHEDYKDTKFTKRIELCSKEYARPCSFLILDNIINVSKELSVYTGTNHASRFSCMWFIPSFLNAQKNLDDGIKARLTQEELDIAVNKYMGLIAEDFKHYDPDLVFVPHFASTADKDVLVNMRTYTLSKTPDLFMPIWDRYELEESVLIDRLDYMYKKLPGEDLIRYDIYRKKKSREEKEQSKP